MHGLPPIWPYQLLRRPYPADLGLSEDEFAIIDNHKSGDWTIRRITERIYPPVTTQDVKEGILSLVRRGLARVGFDEYFGKSEHVPDEEWERVAEMQLRLTERGMVLANAVLLQDDRVVYFQRREDADGRNFLPLVCSVDRDVQLQDKLAPVSFMTPETTSVGREFTHYTKLRVPCTQLMRLDDYLTFPASFGEFGWENVIYHDLPDVKPE